MTMQAPRRYPNVGELEQLVYALVANWVGQLAEFTAYSITLELRNGRPDLEIEHGYVRDLVNVDMTPRLGVVYTTEMRNWNGNVATTFVPLSNVVQQPGQQAFTAPPPKLPTGSIFNWDDDNT